MTGNRLWTLGVAVVIAALVLMGWFLAISPVLGQANAAETQAQGIVTQNTASDASVATLATESKQLPKQQKILTALQAAAPDSAHLADFLDQLQALAQANGVTITNFTAAEAVAYGGVAGAAATPTAPSAASGTTPGAPTPDTSAAATAATGGALAGKLFTVPVTLAMSGPSDQVLSFIKAAQTGIRFFLVTGVTFTGASTPTANGTLTGSIFVLRESLPGAAAQSDTAASPVATPSPTPTPTASATPKPTASATPRPAGTATPTATPIPTPTHTP